MGTDYSELTNQLLEFSEELLHLEPYTCEQRAKAAADALEAQEAELRSLAKEIRIYQQTELTYVTRVADAQREYSEMQAKLKARIAELEAALKDLIEDHEYMTDTEPEEDNLARAYARAAIREGGR